MMRDLKFKVRFAEDSSLPGHTLCCCASGSGRFEIPYFPYNLDF